MLKVAFLILRRTNSFRKNSTVEDEIKIKKDGKSTNYNKKGKYNHYTYKFYISTLTYSLIIGFILSNIITLSLSITSGHILLWILSIEIQISVYILFLERILFNYVKKEEEIWLKNRSKQESEEKLISETGGDE